MDGLESDDYYDIAELESSDEERAEIAGSDSDGDAAAAAADDKQKTQELHSEGNIGSDRKSYRRGKEKQGAAAGRGDSSSRGKATQRQQVCGFFLKERKRLQRNIFASHQALYSLAVLVAAAEEVDRN